MARYERELAYRPQGNRETTVAVVVVAVVVVVDVAAAAYANLDQSRREALHSKKCFRMAAESGVLRECAAVAHPDGGCAELSD